MNEAITNAMKYAFGNEYGQTNIRLSELEDRFAELEISDNGKGLPKDIDPEMAESLGMNPMRGLVGQLEGDLTISCGKGVTVLVRWKRYRLIEKNKSKKKKYD